MTVAGATTGPGESRPARITLEIAVSTADEAHIAEAGGADRLELSSGLEVGGITPSLHTFQSVRSAVSLPVYVLIRPRPGGFQYSANEFVVMLRDAQEFMRGGAAGLVFGVLDGSTIDRDRCRQLATITGGHAVFHRAFDFLPDPLAALDDLIDLGVSRVLTSGGAATAQTGSPLLARLIQHSAGRIEILPAGNVRPENVVQLVRQTGCSQVHSSARAAVAEPLFAQMPGLAAGLGVDGAGNRWTTDPTIVAGLRMALDRLVLGQG